MSKKENIVEKLKVEGKEWADALEFAYSKISKDVKLDGFRKGKVPFNKYIQSFGVDRLYMDAVDKILEVEYPKIVAKHKNIAAKPRVDVSEINEQFASFEFTIVTKPEVKLGKYTNLGIKKEKVAVTKEEVTAEIDNLIKRYADVVEKTEGEVLLGDIAVIDFEGFHNDVPFDGGKGEDYSLEIGSNSFIPGFEDQVIGMKVGEEKEVNVTFPKEYPSDDLKGQDVVFKVKVKAMKTKEYPEMNDQFFKDINMPDVKNKEELEKTLKDSITRQKQMEADNKFMDELLEKIGNNAKVDIPEEMLTDEVERMINEFKERLQMQGMDYNMYLQMTGGDENAMREQMAPEAEKRVLFRLCLEAIKDKEKIEVTDKEIKEETKHLAAKYNMEVDQFSELFGGPDMVKFDLQMRKTLDFVKENN